MVQRTYRRICQGAYATLPLLAAHLLAACAGPRGPGETAADFAIHREDTHGLPGLMHLFGIDSPGLTSSLAIGEYVQQLLD